MTAKEFLDANMVREAEDVLNGHLRQNPGEDVERTFLFELLCFSGQYDRAERHLQVLAGSSRETELGAALYYTALHAERARHEAFRKQTIPQPAQTKPLPGKINGEPFRAITDSDPLIGQRLEVYAAGAYLWVSLEDIASVKIGPPRRLRDTLWATAVIMTGPNFKGAGFGNILLPAIYPFSWNSEDQSVWLGRTTAWAADGEGQEFPVGQKTLIVDGEQVPLLEIRSLEFGCDAVS